MKDGLTILVNPGALYGICLRTWGCSEGDTLEFLLSSQARTELLWGTEGPDFPEASGRDMLLDPVLTFSY